MNYSLENSYLQRHIIVCACLCVDKNGVRVYLLEWPALFSMHSTTLELEQLLELSCSKLPLCSGDAMPVSACSPTRHVSQKLSTCRSPLLVDPCQTIFSGL